MSDLRALLLTDVVDSTALSAGLGDARTAALWAAHDRLARDLLRAWRGREIDKSDGLLAMFECAADAVGYALAYHRALAALEPPLAARAGIDIGPVLLRENAPDDVARGAKPLEVEGLVKPIAARIMPLARGGQTLVSERVRQALGATPLRLQSHGHWRLKGVEEPVELFEVGDRDTAFVPPEAHAKAYRVLRHGELWLPAEEVRHNLPAERDAFVDRQAMLQELARRFEQGARLVSILGIGGTGKTRLATRFAWMWLGDFPGGIWFCDLSQARDADGIVRAVADALDVPLDDDDPIVRLGNAIAGRGRCLVVLDNFEQVARHAEETLGRWLSRAADACFVVTTREVLGLAGEESIALAPLQVDDAAALFMRRARAASSDFAPDAKDERDIARLVSLLDGLPLAIELAAARVRIMPPATLLARMSERFKLLTSMGGRRDRQATLRAAFDWSWDLLAPADKSALAQLSVFEGGFTLEAAEAVLDLSAAGGWALDAVQSLVEKSLVRHVGERRFGLLASVQEYATEHLRTPGRYEGSGPAAALAAETRHGEFFAGFGEQRAIAECCDDIANLMTACRRAATRGEGETAAAALESAWAALELRGPFQAGIVLAALLRPLPLSSEASTRVERVIGRSLHASGHAAQALAHYEAALRLARETGDRRHEADLLVRLGDLHANAGRLEQAEADQTRALGLARDLGDARIEANALRGLGVLDDFRGRYAQARRRYEDAIAVARRAGHLRDEGGILGNLGLLHANQGHMDEARTHFEASLAIAERVGDRQWAGNALSNLGLLHQVTGHADEARDKLSAALSIARDIGHAQLECIVLCNLGIVFEQLGSTGEAGEHYDAALQVARQLGDGRSEGQILNYLGLLQARQGRFDEARRALAAGEALLADVSDRIGLATLMCSRAEAEHLAGARAAAAAALAAAERLADEMGVDERSELGIALARTRELLARGA